MSIEHGSEWEKVINILYSGSQKSIEKVSRSEIFKYYSKVFQDTAYLDEMKSLLDELEESTNKILNKIDRHYIQSINLIQFFFRGRCGIGKGLIKIFFISSITII